jgi:hypothetical protein
MLLRHKLRITGILTFRTGKKYDRKYEEKSI